MWPFGRKKESTDESRCAECGRTLLAGEWTQRMIDDDGDEILLCSLCSQARSSDPMVDETSAAATGARQEMNGRDGKRKSDAFWRALKEKDAEIDELRARLSRSEAEKEELQAQLARLRGEATGASESQSADIAPAPPLAVPSDSLGDSPMESPAVASPLAREDAASGETTEGWPEPIVVVEGHDADVEDTLAGIVGDQATPASGDDESMGEDSLAAAAAVDAAAVDAAPVEPVVAGLALGGERSDAVVAEGEGGGEAAMSDETAVTHVAETPSEPADADAGFLTDEELHLLQRGVDLLNVSPVPKKIAETSESLGIPFVHVAGEPDGAISVTFLWALGWYRFSVRLEDAGSVRLADRGYEELPDLQPNGTVRGDGTVQLAPTFGKRPTPREEAPVEAEPSVSTATVTSGVIISKSLMGQRTDDEPTVPWEGQSARDFDWGR